MSIEITTAIIALFGIVISVGASVLISTRQTKIELDKLRTEIQKTYADKLLDQRLAVYPSLYKLLSDFDKVIRYGTLSKSAIQQLWENMLEWDSKHGILLSGRSGSIYVGLRKVLSKLANLTDDEFEKEFISTNARDDLLKQANAVEVALKHDLGIYVVEFKDIDRKFSSYQEIGKIARSDQKK